ncbi:hypothetical protein Tco_0499728, partial [Tanacetum coccineum]
MEDSFRKHVDSLLKIGVIRPSKSRHRTMAMIVNSGTTVDPVTGREVKGKERIIFCGSSAIASKAEYAPGYAVRHCCHINFSLSPRRFSTKANFA